jgi:uncharacterized protein
MTLDDMKVCPNGLLTHSLVIFDVLNPKIEHLRMKDIAHALSNLCRYGGHSPEFYSVAQHAVLCSYFPGTPLQQLAFLHHDDSEAYLVDMPRPIKKNLKEYVVIEENLQSIIFPWLGLEYPYSQEVHEVDDNMLKIEYKAFFGDEGENDPNFEFWSPKEAKQRFLDRHEELIKMIK